VKNRVHHRDKPGGVRLFHTFSFPRQPGQDSLTLAEIRRCVNACIRITAPADAGSTDIGGTVHPRGLTPAVLTFVEPPLLQPYFFYTTLINCTSQKLNECVFRNELTHRN
jgi:hypothetical protein